MELVLPDRSNAASGSTPCDPDELGSLIGERGVPMTVVTA